MVGLEKRWVGLHRLRFMGSGWRVLRSSLTLYIKLNVLHLNLKPPCIKLIFNYKNSSDLGNKYAAHRLKLARKFTHSEGQII
jgi:hypothetical protein